MIAGCVGEYIAEFREIPRDASARKRFERRSLKILIAGLAIGLVGLFKTTQLSGLEIARLNELAARSELARAELEAQIKQAEITMLSKTPGKMRVVAASAVAIIRLDTNSVSISTNRLGPHGTMLLFFGTKGTSLGMSCTEESWPTTRGSGHLYYVGDNELRLRFESNPGSSVFRLSAPVQTAEELIDEFKQFLIVPGNMHRIQLPILGGSVTLLLNGSVSKRFAIPPQTLFVLRTNTVTGHCESHWMIDNVQP